MVAGADWTAEKGGGTAKEEGMGEKGASAAMTETGCESADGADESSVCDHSGDGAYAGCGCEVVAVAVKEAGVVEAEASEAAWVEVTEDLCHTQ